MKISLLLPTRQRRKELIRFWTSAMNMADQPSDVEVVAYVDHDDVSTYEGLKLRGLTFIIGPRIVLSEGWNECWRAAKGEYFMHCGDDLVFRSKGWDTAFTEAIDAYPGKIAFVWGDDLNSDSQRNEFGTHGMVHKNWTDVVGRFVPPYFESDYNDTWFNDVAQTLNVRRYLHDVKTEHMHFSLGKSDMDNNTKERLVRHERQQPDRIYNSLEKQAERALEVERLREFINAWPKD
jgi:hypothetical protein